MKLISRDEVQELIDLGEAPAVSIYMPAEIAGKETLQNPIRFKNLLRSAEERLARNDSLRPREREELLKPAQDLAGDGLFWQHQNHGLAMFLAPGLFRYYRTPIRFEELSVVASRFHVKPLLQLLTGDGRFYALALDRKEVKLYEGTRYEIAEIGMGDTPTSFSDVVGHEVEEKHLQWRSGASSGGRHGASPAQFHGHGGGKDDIKPELRKFFAVVDRGLRERIAGQEAPVVLAAVEYLLPIYRAAGSCPQIVEEEIRRNPSELSADELRERAWSIVEPRFTRDEEEAATRYRELAGTGRAADTVEEIVPASADGRVEILFVARACQRWGLYDPDSRRLELHEDPLDGSRDLLDVAAVQTLVHGGRIYVVAPERIPAAGAPIAALYRY